jgi:hypothetical protein
MEKPWKFNVSKAFCFPFVFQILGGISRQNPVLCQSGVKRTRKRQGTQRTQVWTDKVGNRDKLFVAEWGNL